MSVGSVDLATYQEDLENVLAWLLEAEEIVEKQEPIGGEVKKVKEQFNQHEVPSILIVRLKILQALTFEDYLFLCLSVCNFDIYMTMRGILKCVKT